MRDLQTAPIKNFALGIYDGPHATPKESDEGPVFLGIKNVTTEGRLDLSEIRHVSEQEYPKWTRRVTPQKDDVVFSYEATLHRYALIPEGFRGCLGRRMALVRPDKNKIIPQFLHYYFLSPAWKAVIEANIINGATVDRIPIKKFPDFVISIPTISKQRSISDILSAYDDLIENNRRRIQLLEQAARLLYKEWFVHLRFPGHEHVKIVDGVPEGWEKRALKALAQVNSRSIKKGFDGDIDYIDISTVTPGHIGETTRYRFSEAPSRARRVVQHGDIIWSCVRPNRKSHAIVWHPQENLIASTGFAVISPNGVPTSYLYQALTTHEFVGYLSNNAQGAAYPAVKAVDFEKAEILMPDKQRLRLFNDITEPMIEQSYLLESQSAQLAKARDFLLPRLMNGEVGV